MPNWTTPTSLQKQRKEYTRLRPEPANYRPFSRKKSPPKIPPKISNSPRTKKNKSPRRSSSAPPTTRFDRTRRNNERISKTKTRKAPRVSEAAKAAMRQTRNVGKAAINKPVNFGKYVMNQGKYVGPTSAELYRLGQAEGLAVALDRKDWHNRQLAKNPTKQHVLALFPMNQTYDDEDKYLVNEGINLWFNRFAPNARRRFFRAFNTHKPTIKDMWKYQNYYNTKLGIRNKNLLEVDFKNPKMNDIKALGMNSIEEWFKRFPRSLYSWYGLYNDPDKNYNLAKNSAIATRDGARFLTRKTGEGLVYGTNKVRTAIKNRNEAAKTKKGKFIDIPPGLKKGQEHVYTRKGIRHYYTVPDDYNEQTEKPQTLTVDLRPFTGPRRAVHGVRYGTRKVREGLEYGTNKVRTAIKNRNEAAKTKKGKFIVIPPGLKKGQEHVYTRKGIRYYCSR
jgi:hypothetical protein